MFKVGAKKEEEGHDGRFFEISDGKSACHSHGDEHVDAHHFHAQGLKGLDGDRQHPEYGRCDERPFKKEHEAGAPLDNESCCDQDPDHKRDLIFISQNNSLHSDDYFGSAV